MSKQQPATSFRKALIPVVVIVALVAGALLLIHSRSGGSTPDGTQLADVEVGATLPDFTLYSLNKSSEPVSSIKAKLVLVNFWASWCGPCMQEMPSLVKLRDAYKDRGLEVVGVNVDEDPASVVPDISRRMHIRFPVFVDRDQKLSELFNVQALPLSVIMDHDRKVLAVQMGGVDWTDGAVRAKIEKWLSG